MKVVHLSATDADDLVGKLKAATPLSEAESRTTAEVIESWQYVVMLAEAGKLGRRIERLLGINSSNKPDNVDSSGQAPDSVGHREDDKPKEPGASTATGTLESGLAPSPDNAERPGQGAEQSAIACEPTNDGSASGSSDSEAQGGPSAGDDEPNKNRDAHGRRGWDDFPSVPVQHLSHSELTIGCQCPECLRGRLYGAKPARLVVISGQAPLVGSRYIAQRLQCGFCKAVFTATNDELDRDGVNGRRLYTHSAAAVVAIVKYFAGMPWFRQQFLQLAVGVEVPDASLADVCERLAEVLIHVVRYLFTLARSARLFLGDDTGAVILDLRKTTRTRRASSEEVERTGGHVSCVIAETFDGKRLVLFRVGIQHTGELMDEVLRGRDPSLPAPLFMGDCHACNTVSVCHTIHGGCNAHAVRRFKEIKQRYPVEAGYALERYDTIFDNDTQCKNDGLDDQQRLAFHVEHSKPLFQEVCAYGEQLLEDKKYEPNSDIAYFPRKRDWTFSEFPVFNFGSHPKSTPQSVCRTGLPILHNHCCA